MGKTKRAERNWAVGELWDEIRSLRARIAALEAADAERVRVRILTPEQLAQERMARRTETATPIPRFEAVP